MRKLSLLVGAISTTIILSTIFKNIMDMIGDTKPSFENVCILLSMLAVNVLLVACAGELFIAACKGE